MELTALVLPLMVVSSFNYLGWVLLESDDNWQTVIWNLQRAQRKWARLSWVIGREGLDARTLGMFYTVVVQAVLLYRSELWVMSL